MAGFLLRLAVVHWVPTQPTSDFWSYYHRALNLVSTGRYEAIPHRADANHPPGYPLVLVPAFLAVPNHTLGAAKVVNCGLAAAAIALVGLLTRRVAGDRPGLLAAAILAFLPRSLLMVCLVASENLFSPLWIAFAWLGIESSRSRRGEAFALGGGLLLGLAALTRTVVYYAFPLWALAGLAGRKRWRRIAAETLLVVAVEHAVMLPWALRNRAELGRLLFTNTAGGYGLYLGNNPRATGDWYDGSADLERISPGVLRRGALAADAVSRKAAWNWMRANPSRAAALYVRKFATVFRQTFIVASFAVYGEKVEPPVPGIDVLPGPHSLKNHPHLLNGTLWATGWGLVIAGVAGWFLLARRALRTRQAFEAAAALVLPAAALYVPVVSALIAVNGRYRWPVEDLMVPAAAIALISVLPRRAAPA